MEGRPWLRILLVVVAFALVGMPVWSLTRERAVATPAARKADTPAESLHVAVTFAEPPASFALEYLGIVLCEGVGPKREFACDWAVAVPPEGVDLLVKADWPTATPKTAVRLEVTRAGETLADQTFWAEGDIVEAVTVLGVSR